MGRTGLSQTLDPPKKSQMAGKSRFSDSFARGRERVAGRALGIVVPDEPKAKVRERTIGARSRADPWRATGSRIAKGIGGWRKDVSVILKSVGSIDLVFPHGKTGPAEPFEGFEVTNDLGDRSAPAVGFTKETDGRGNAAIGRIGLSTSVGGLVRSQPEVEAKPDPRSNVRSMGSLVARSCRLISIP